MTAADLVALLERFGFPATLVVILLWKVIPALDEMKKALWTLSDPDKTAARFKEPLEEQAKYIVREVDHNTRGALGNYAIRHRDGHGQ